MRRTRNQVHRGRLPPDVLRASGAAASVYALVVAIWRKCAGIDALPSGTSHRDTIGLGGAGLK
jgi:hypothetical protein